METPFEIKRFVDARTSESRWPVLRHRHRSCLALHRQPLVEIEGYGESDPERRIGAGLSTIDAGFRLRYEIRREFAPYVGVVWARKFFGTADFARAASEDVGGPRLVPGARIWF